MAAVEGQVIGVHSVDAWKEHIEKGKESKKLVIV
jgi:thioredoxin 1